MKQDNKITLETTKRQQERLIKKLYAEKEMLELALDDKIAQIQLQEMVLDKIVKGDR